MVIACGNNLSGASYTVVSGETERLDAVVNSNGMAIYDEPGAASVTIAADMPIGNETYAWIGTPVAAIVAGGVTCGARALVGVGC